MPLRYRTYGSSEAPRTEEPDSWFLSVNLRQVCLKARGVPGFDRARCGRPLFAWWFAPDDAARCPECTALLKPAEVG